MSVALVRRILGADVVVAHMVNAPAYLAALAACASRKPIAALVAISPEMPRVELNQTQTPGFGGLARRVAAQFLTSNVVAVATTSDIERGLKALGFRRIVRIPYGVVDPGPADRGRLRDRLLPPLGISPAAQLVVACGRLTWQKGFDRLLSAWATNSDEPRDRFLLIVGSGPDGERLERRSRELGISPTVRFVSADPRGAVEYLASADVFVISSRYEGMANVLLEAMAAGVPVVSTPVSGSVDLIQDGYNGRIVPHDDPIALTSAIEDLLRDPDDLGRRGRETVLAACSLEHVVDLYERLFANVRELSPGIITSEELLGLDFAPLNEGTPCVESAG